MTGNGESHRATYNDGKTAARRDVRVRLQAECLRIEDSAGGEVAVWPYAELRLAEEHFKGAPPRLRCQGDARLTLLDSELLPVLARRAPAVKQESGGFAWQAVKWLFYAGTAVAVLAGFLLLALPRMAATVATIVPRSWEVRLGDELVGTASEIFARLDGQTSVKVCNAASGRAVLRQLTERTVGGAELAYDLRVRVLDISLINAFALPGGQIIVFRGLLDFAVSPDEVAGVLAHEVGHVIARHSTKRILEAMGTGLFFGVLLGDLGSSAAALIGRSLVEAGYSRDDEIEADAIAARLLRDGGISAQGLVEFFGRVESSAAGDLGPLLQVFSSHPSGRTRAEMLRDSMHKAPPSLSAAGWRALQSICDESFTQSQDLE